MLIPSIDLSGGNTVQWIGGVARALELGDPAPFARRFGRVGQVAIIDLDAALGQGDQSALIRERVLPYLTRARVGGGIRERATAERWLDLGAESVIIGSKATPEFCRALPKERVIAACDAKDGRVMIKGWREDAGIGLLDHVRSLREVVGGFLITFIEREGRLQGTDLARAAEVIAAAAPARVTIAGGISTPKEIVHLDALGADAQVGMALYKGQFSEADVLSAQLQAAAGSPPWPTLVTDERGVALGLAWSDPQSLAIALQEGVGAYHSRRRGLWIKGLTSGNTQELLSVDLDCDRDALRFRVRQTGTGFCHLGTRTCFGAANGIPALEATMAARQQEAIAGSYVQRLLRDPDLLHKKILEEAQELVQATGRDAVRHEATDLLFFTAVALAKQGLNFQDVEREFDARARRVTRRPGNAKQ